MNEKVFAQRAKVQLLEIFLPLGRCQPVELEKARALLVELEKVSIASPLAPGGGIKGPLAPGGGISSHLAAKVVTATEQTMTSDVKTMMSRLMDEHKVLRKLQAAKGNMLNLIPASQNAKHLTDECIELAKKIEAIWDQYRHLERYGRLPNEDDMLELPELTQEQINKKNALKVDLMKWRNIKQKAIAKLDNPQNFVSTAKSLNDKPAEWRQQLFEAEDAVRTIELELNALER